MKLGLCFNTTYFCGIHSVEEGVTLNPVPRRRFHKNHENPGADYLLESSLAISYLRVSHTVF